MPHPLFGRRLSLMSVAEIRRILEESPPDEATLEKLLRDPRAGVRALGRPHRGSPDRKALLEEHYAEMSAFENRFRAEGVTSIAGLDEAGRGPLAGPAAVGCVILPEGGKFPGLDDSKRMSPRAREAMYALLTTEALAWSVVLIDHLDIDELGIHGAVLKGMRLAVDSLGVNPDLALVDGKFLPGLGCRERAIVDGDALCLSIAAASVIAKVTRDRHMVQMDERYPGYGFASHKGYGSAEHVEALRRLGPCDIHRFSFHTIADTASSGTIRTVLERRLRIATTRFDLERAANGIGRNSLYFRESDLNYLRGVYRECLKALEKSTEER